MNAAQQHEIERIESLYNDAIERQTDAIRRQYGIQLAHLKEKMQHEINYMEQERRTAMYNEMQAFKTSVGAK